MLLQIPDILSAEQVAEFRARLDAADWADGRITAGHQSAKAKETRSSGGFAGRPRTRPAGARCVGTQQHLLLRGVAAQDLSAAVQSLRRGQSFGFHVDNAVRYDRSRGVAEPVRTDVSATLFLAGPEEYDGGELIIEDTFGTQAVKLPAGHLVLYPGTSLHRVAPVTRGARVASFFWIQSSCARTRSGD